MANWIEYLPEDMQSNYGDKIKKAQIWAEVLYQASLKATDAIVQVEEEFALELPDEDTRLLWDQFLGNTEYTQMMDSLFFQEAYYTLADAITRFRQEYL